MYVPRTALADPAEVSLRQPEIRFLITLSLLLSLPSFLPRKSSLPDGGGRGNLECMQSRFNAICCSFVELSWRTPALSPFSTQGHSAGRRPPEREIRRRYSVRSFLSFFRGLSGLLSFPHVRAFKCVSHHYIPRPLALHAPP